MTPRVGVALAVFAAVTGGLASAQPKPAAPAWTHAHDLQVRAGGKKDFNKDTPKVGVEFFRDEAHGAVVAVSEGGFLAVVPAAASGKEKKAEWLYAHDLKSRKAGEAEFTPGTKVFGVEAFKDTATGQLLYACESTAIALAPAPAAAGPAAANKGPKWRHAFEPKVRGGDDDLFDKAKKLGVEVFTDENSGGLIYVTEAGAIAAAPAPGATAKVPEKGKELPLAAQYGFMLRVRGALDADFTDATKKVGVEVFADPYTGGLVYLTEAGAVATAPFPAQIAPGKATVTWVGAMNLKARRGGEKDFDKAKKYGIEVFKDGKTGHLVYVSETGAIAVLPK